MTDIHGRKGDDMPAELVGACSGQGTALPSLPELRDPDPLGRIRRDFGITGAPTDSDELAIDLTGVGSSALRIEWGSVVANVLANSLRGKHLSLNLPSDPGAHMRLARSGMYFALARQQGLDWSGLAESSRKLLTRWSADWEPADVHQPLFYFGEHLVGATGNLAPHEQEFVAFLNPDRVPQSEAMDDQNAVVYPWLRAMLNTAGGPRQNWHENVLQEVTLAVEELLDNIRQHAQVGHNGLSFVSHSISDGSASRCSELHLTVFDSGAGMPDTIAKSYDHDKSVVSMVEDAFNGKLPNRARDRGRGLHRVANLVERLKGRLFVATGPAYDGQTVVINYSGTQSSVAGGFLAPVGVKGTVVVLTLPLEPASA